MQIHFHIYTCTYLQINFYMKIRSYIRNLCYIFAECNVNLFRLFLNLFLNVFCLNVINIVDVGLSLQLSSRPLSPR